MRNILLCLFTILSVSVLGQISPDDELILRNISDSASPYYYPELFARYAEGDTTLTLDDYHHLYYGYAFQNAYKPLNANTAADNILNMFNIEVKSEDERNRQILKYALQSFEYDPFSPTNINFLTYAYGQLGDSVNEQINFDRFKKVVQTIQDSGTGLKEDQAWHILYFTHATDIMALNGWQPATRTVVSRTTEYIPLLEKQKGKPKGYYFDYSRIYMTKPDNYERPKSSGFQINGINTKK